MAPHDFPPLEPSEIARALRAGIAVPDAAIDRFLPPDLRTLASRFWTPVDVAATAAWWLWELGARRVLDLGSGAGKFCVTAALTRDLCLTGVEQRGALVASAEELALALGAEERARFVHGRIDSVDPAAFDAFYAFNPFEENLFRGPDRIDSSVELSPRRLMTDLDYVEAMLARSRAGTLFLTYHGFGGRIPLTYDLVREDEIGTNVLRAWRKSNRAPTGAAWVEVGYRTMRVDRAPTDRKDVS